MSFVKYAEAVVVPSILAVGFITNTISVVILMGASITPNLRICIVSLTLSDLFATVAGFTQVMVEVLAYEGNIPHGRWEGPAVASNILFYVYMMFLCTSASLVILLVALRCCLVLRPLATRRFLTSRRTKWLCVLTFIGVFLLYVPTTFNVVWQGCFNDTHTFCVDTLEKMPDLKNANTYVYILTVLFGPVLVALYVICFIMITITLRNANKAMPALMQRQASAEQAHRRRGSITSRITKTLLFILVLDTVCTLPTIIQGVGLVLAPEKVVFDNKSPGYRVFDALAEIMLCLRPAYNFWLYVFTHQEFRRRGHQLLYLLQYKCRCFVLGLIRNPSDETLSRSTEFTGMHHDGSSPASPTASKAFRISPLSPKARLQLEKQLELEQQKKYGSNGKSVMTAL